MERKNFLFVLISLFAIAFLLSGCSTNKVPTDAKVVSDVPANTATTNTATPATTNQNVVDSTFKNDVVSNSSDVEIGSLLN